MTCSVCNELEVLAVNVVDSCTSKINIYATSRAFRRVSRLSVGVNTWNCAGCRARRWRFYWLGTW